MDNNAPTQAGSDLSLTSFSGVPPVSNAPTMPTVSPAPTLPKQPTEQQVQTGQSNAAVAQPPRPAFLPQPVDSNQQTPTPVAPSVPQWRMPSQSQNIPSMPLINNLENASVQQMLQLVAQKNASDLHLVVGYPPMLRIDGALVGISQQILNPQINEKLIYEIIAEDKKEQLEVNREVDLAYGVEGIGRFRINAYYQRGYLSAAFRLIPHRIRSVAELRLPDIFNSFADLQQGLVLMTGPTGHGKSSSLAAIIQRINETYSKHILTIEDPIEYVFPQSKSLVSQRELGDDTHSWKGALRAALREDPDVVLVGEMRDLETINAAVTVAETGHLVFATLHTNNAAQTIQRIINVFPDVQQEEIRSQLADILEVVVAQRLVPVRGGGRRAVVEIMLMTPAIRNLIRENKIYQIDNVIRTSLDLGMTTLERSLLAIYHEGLIDQDTALKYALDPNEMLRLIQESG